VYRVSVSCSCIHFYMLYRTDICIYTCFRIKQINPFFTKSKMFPYGVTNRQLRYEMLFVTMNPWSCGKDCVECYKSGCKQVLWSNHGVKPNPRRRYGAPISRKRLYLVMIENSVMREEVKQQDFTDYIKKKLDEMKIPTKICWSLTSTSEQLQKHMPSRMVC
jgi:hypothetical protein